MNSKTAVLLFTMLILGGMLVTGSTLASTAYAQPAEEEEELVSDLLDDLGISEEELDNLLDNLDIIDNRLVRDLLDNLDIIDEEEDDEVVWCYLRQGDVRVCFETQEECQQALEEDDLSVTSHCERFETPPPNAVFP